MIIDGTISRVVMGIKSWTSDCEPDRAEACVCHGVGNLRINLVDICSTSKNVTENQRQR